MPVDKVNLATVQKMWRREVEAAAIYRHLANRERDHRRQAILMRLADQEDRHAARWSERIAAATGRTPDPDDCTFCRFVSVCGDAHACSWRFSNAAICASTNLRRGRSRSSSSATAAGNLRPGQSRTGCFNSRCESWPATPCHDSNDNLRARCAVRSFLSRSSSRCNRRASSCSGLGTRTTRHRRSPCW